MFDVAFSVVHEGNPEDVPLEVLLEAMDARLKSLRQYPDDAVEAFGVCDSYDNED